MKKIVKTIMVVVIGIMVMCMGGCSDKVVEDEFEVCRKITLIDLYTGEAICSVRGAMAVERVYDNGEGEEIKVVIKTEEDEYITHYFGINEHISYVIEEERSPIVMKGYWEIEWYIKRG